MKKLPLALMGLMALLSGCGLASRIDRSTAEINRNREMIDRSTEAIYRNHKILEEEAAKNP